MTSLGRVVGRDINGVSRSDSYDALGRLTGETNALGAFTYGYDGVTNRLVNMGYPNGQTTLLSYLPTNQEHRLSDIHNKLTGGTTLSRFQFGYAPDGTLTTWSQQMDADPARMYTFEHDGVNRLISATLKTTDATPVTVKRYGYSYDKNSNRVGEQIDDGSSSATVNALNALNGSAQTQSAFQEERIRTPMSVACRRMRAIPKACCCRQPRRLAPVCCSAPES
jgi:hypothetical protein